MANGAIRKLVAIGLSLTLPASIPLDSFADSLSLTTWYPAPYGVYSKLRSTQDAYFAYQGGNVGIGTTVPGYKMDVAGHIRITNANNAAVAGAGMEMSYIPSQKRGDIMTFDRDSGVSGMLVLQAAGGNVGIGTTSPQSLLHLNFPAGGYQTLQYPSNANGYAGLAFNDGTTNRAYISWEDSYQNNKALKFYIGNGSNSNVKLTLQENGNVGIGTATPATKLHVIGSDAASGRFAMFQSAMADRGGMLLLDSGGNQQVRFGFGPYIYSGAGSGDAALGSEAGKKLHFGTNGDNIRMTIDTSGNVGIGTTIPAAKLQVGSSGDGTVALANAWNTFSSRRFKENVRPIGGALDKISRLRGVEFEWKGSGKRDLGVVAEEVGQVFPEIVDYETGGRDARGLDYSKLVAPLIEAVKELENRNEAQQAEIDGLKKELRNLKTK